MHIEKTEINKPKSDSLIEHSRKDGKLSTSIFSGLIWFSLQLLFTGFLAYTIKLILARLLLPRDFGLIGMAVVFINFIKTFGDLGIAAVLIQRDENNLREEHFTTAFWISISFSLLIILIFIFIVGPFANWFYEEPLLRLIVPVLSVSTFLTSVGLVQRIKLTRDLKFKKISLIDILANFVGGIFAVIFAFVGFGVWSLVFQPIITAFITTILLWQNVRWLPVLKFSKSAFSEILELGIFDSIQHLIFYFSKNLDVLLIGRFLGADLVGFYSMAFFLTDTFRAQIMAVLNKIMFPIYGKLQNNIESIKVYYLKVIKFNTIIITPFMACLIVFAEPFVKIFLGEIWVLSVFPIQAMAFASIIHAIGGTTDAVFRGLGKFRLNFLISFSTLLTIPALFAGIYFGGINGAALFVVLQKTINRIVYQYFMKKHVNISEKDILVSIWPSFIGISSVLPFMILQNLFFTSYNPIVLFFSIIIYILIFFIIVYLLDKSEIDIIVSKTKTYLAR